MHLQPRGRRNMGPLQGVPPVQRTGHPHRLKPNPHHRTARRMAGAVSGDPATHHRPQADGGAQGSPQGTRPHCRLHLATHPRGGPPGHGGAHAADGRCQDGRAALIPHPQIPAACGNPAPNRPSPPPQTPVLPTMRTYPVTYQHGTPTTSTHTVHRAQHWQSTHGHHRHRTHSNQHARATSPHLPTPPSVHRYHQPPATACPLCVRQRLPQTALPCNPDHWVCLGAAHRLTHSPHCGDLNPRHRERPAAPAAPPPPPATPASSGSSPTPSGTTWEGTTWRTRRTTHGP